MKKIMSMTICLALLLALTCIHIPAQAKKYENICGKYEFETPDGTMNIEFYEEDGKLMAAPEGETAEEILPVEGVPMKFDITVSSNGVYYEIQFKKDEAGKYNLCTIIAMGMEIEGKRIKE